jgi:hypothetical protein
VPLLLLLMNDAPAYPVLATRAITPEFRQWFIFYTSPLVAGLHVADTWSPDNEAAVRDVFNCEFIDELPQVLFLTCPGAN